MKKPKLLSKIGRKKTTQIQRVLYQRGKDFYIQVLYVHLESGWTCSQIMYSKKLNINL